MDMKLNINELKAMSFDYIRRQVSNLNNNMSLNEIGAYTKGIVDLESEIFGDYMSAVRSAEE